MDENYEGEELDNVVILNDENGNEVKFEFLDLVELDEERKAAMVSNLLVVLCGNHDAQPIVNTGSLY